MSPQLCSTGHKGFGQAPAAMADPQGLAWLQQQLQRNVQAVAQNLQNVTARAAELCHQAFMPQRTGVPLLAVSPPRRWASPGPSLGPDALTRWPLPPAACSR